MLFVTNIRYGNSPVRKVYLGEKLIWQCVDVAGNTELLSSASAHFYATNIDSLLGESKNILCNDSILNTPKLVFFVSDIEHCSYTDSMAMAAQLLHILSDTTKSETYMDVFMKIFDANPMNGLSKSKSDTLVESRVVAIDDMLSKINVDCNINDAIGLALMSKFIGGDETFNFNTTSAVGGINISDLISYIAMQSDGTATMSCLNSLDMRSSLEFILNNSSSIIDLLDVLSMKSDTESNFDSDSLVKFYKSVVGYSNSKIKTYIDNFIGKYFAIVIDADANSESYGSASAILWYPPIGDGVPLFENDDVDITKNGNTLEIQQAYQINIDEENGILEVI